MGEGQGVAECCQSRPYRPIEHGREWIKRPSVVALLHVREVAEYSCQEQGSAQEPGNRMRHFQLLDMIICTCEV